MDEIDKRLKHALGVTAIGLFVTRVEAAQFGRLLIFHMWNSPWTGGDKFTLTLIDCTHIDWSVDILGFDPPGSEGPYGADVIGVHLGGEPNKGGQFYIETDVFNLGARYAAWEVTVLAKG